MAVSLRRRRQQSGHCLVECRSLAGGTSDHRRNHACQFFAELCVTLSRNNAKYFIGSRIVRPHKKIEPELLLLILLPLGRSDGRTHTLQHTENVYRQLRERAYCLINKRLPVKSVPVRAETGTQTGRDLHLSDTCETVSCHRDVCRINRSD
jgi:hypothetical protein